MFKVLKIYFLIAIMLVAQIGSTGVMYFENTCLALNTTEISFRTDSCGCQPELNCSKTEEPYIQSTCCYHTSHVLQTSVESKSISKVVKEKFTKNVKTPKNFLSSIYVYPGSKTMSTVQDSPLFKRITPSKRILFQSFQI